MLAVVARVLSRRVFGEVLNTGIGLFQWLFYFSDFGWTYRMGNPSEMEIYQYDMTSTMHFRGSVRERLCVGGGGGRGGARVSEYVCLSVCLSVSMCVYACV